MIFSPDGNGILLFWCSEQKIKCTTGLASNVNYLSKAPKISILNNSQLFWNLVKL